MKKDQILFFSTLNILYIFKHVHCNGHQFSMVLRQHRHLTLRNHSRVQIKIDKITNVFGNSIRLLTFSTLATMN